MPAPATLRAPWSSDSVSYTLGYPIIEPTDATVLGAFEAGFAASLIFYLTTFYTRGELGKVSRDTRYWWSEN
jgi:hypothetical protein